MRNYIKEFFYLQRDDRRAVLTLLALAVVALSLIFWLGESSSPPPTAKKTNSRKKANREYANGRTNSAEKYYRVEEVKAERFPFDPNTADSTQLLRLGLAPWQVRSIYRYRAKGGTFRQPSDFARLYGLTRKQYRELRPYIRISPDYLPAADYYAPRRTSNNARSMDSSATKAPRYTYTARHKLRPGEHIAINSADTTQLQKIPGIGSAYARMIIRYRERLGGFITMAQVLESGPVPESALRYITIDATQVRKLNINKLSLNQLRRHPYINFYQAKAICEYRRLHGPLHSLEELRFSPDFPPAQIERLQPYVTF
ncbi:putative uncharacterized protein [Prevotella sp. CAG:1320]|nr:putative uncharacterized protein [Prevotella sp. CAG:1320]